MDKRGFANKTVFSSTQEGVTTGIGIRYNPRTDHITLGFTFFHKSPGFNNGSVNNKQCASYLGITIAERVLSKVFKNVERMPYKNPGYDFKCNNGYKIDVKGATKMKNQNAWSFHIRHNQIADYFLCLAFDDRKNLNPLHIQLIPDEKVNHLKGLTISASRIDKWDEYALDINKVSACCNALKEG